MGKPARVDIVVPVSSIQEAAELFLLLRRREPRGVRRTSGYQQLVEYIAKHTGDDNLGVIEGDIAIAHLLKRNDIKNLQTLKETPDDVLLSYDDIGPQRLKKIRAFQKMKF